MNINIPQLLAKGEGISVEFKRAKIKLPKTLFETVCAFLNRNGGGILLNANKPHVYGQLFPDNFKPFPKNPYIAQIFTQMGRSEELDVYKYSKDYSGSDDIQFIEEDIFITKVPLIPNTTDKTVGKNVSKTIGGQIGGQTTIKTLRCT